VIELTPRNFGSVGDLVLAMPENNLFALSVIIHHVRGRVFVNRRDDVTVCHVVHPYGMSLLAGTVADEDFNRAFVEYALGRDGRRATAEYMQAHPREWGPVLAGLFGRRLSRASEPPDLGHVGLATRVNFRFDQHLHLERVGSVVNAQVRRTTLSDLHDFPGSVIPTAFWPDANTFIDHGVGYTALERGTPVSVAFSSFLHDGQLELGIETSPDARGRGHASRACTALIAHCLERDLTPVWACREDNTASYALAVRLGFRPTDAVPYYVFAPPR
jgi:GNAT superfamily N-acetyltransferase